jgi:PucR family transcriptional regulator, purine catabolism regulatory protein
MTVTLARLLSAGFFPAHTVVGASWMLCSPVDRVTVVSDVASVALVESLALVVFTGGCEHDTRVAIQMAAHHNVVGLVLNRPDDPLTAGTRSFAEASGVALVLVDHDLPDQLAVAMDQFVRGPAPRRPRQLTAGSTGVPEDVLGVVAHRLRSVDGGLEEMLRVLSVTLGAEVGLAIAGGRVVAGDLDADALRGPGDVLARLATGRPVPWVRSRQDGLLLGEPVELTSGLPANLWLVAGTTEMSASRVRITRQALAIAAWALVAYLAGRSLDLSTRDRDHHLLLSRLIDDADRPSLPAVEQATALGWHLTGWHTAIRITTHRIRAVLPRGAVGALLHRHLSAQGVDALPLSGEDDWTLWSTEVTRPARPDDVRDRVQAALLTAQRELPGVPLCAGVGAAGEGLAGLRESLTQAREASLLASTRDVPCAVERLGRDSVSRILVGHHLAGPQHELAQHLLRPLTDADPTGQLLHTLGRYLDHESSATATASALGVHRNTVLQRLDRIRVLLEVDLSDVDQRLALHLATRLTRMAATENVGAATAS